MLSFCVLTQCLGAENETPIWRIDLRSFGYNWQAEVVLKFAGNLMVIYPDRDRPPLVFDTQTRKLLDQAELKGVRLPPREAPDLTRFRKPAPEMNVIARWNQMEIQQIGGVGVGPPGTAEYYLQEPGKPKQLLLRASCTTRDPQFAGDEYILLRLCDGKNVVVNKSGRRIYALPELSEPYVAPNFEGTKFVAYERGGSFFHPFKGTDWLRVTVFSSSDGKKLFEYRWKIERERTNDGRAALSDNGSLVALVRAGEILVFAIPAQHK